MRHKHAELIHAWADGAEIQWRMNDQDHWRDLPDNNPAFHPNYQYRVKPQPQFVTQEYGVFLRQSTPVFVPGQPANLRLIFEGEKLIDVELIGNE